MQCATEQGENVFVGLGLCNEVPWIGWLKEYLLLLVLEAGSLGSGSQHGQGLSSPGLSSSSFYKGLNLLPGLHPHDLI